MSMGVINLTMKYEFKTSNIIKEQKRICLHILACFDRRFNPYLSNLSIYAYPSVRRTPGAFTTVTLNMYIVYKKVMLCIWWDTKGVLYYELPEPNQTFTKERYRDQIILLNEELERKWPFTGKGRRAVKLLRDNARPHVSKVVRDTLHTLSCD